jgi:hypothetical protein
MTHQLHRPTVISPRSCNDSNTPQTSVDSANNFAYSLVGHAQSRRRTEQPRCAQRVTTSFTQPVLTDRPKRSNTLAAAAA